MANSSLIWRAGPKARQIVERRGLDPALIRVLPGASGGAKWLILKHLDQAILPWLLNGRTDPLHVIGSSIGTWRFTCYAQPDPVAAFDRFLAIYLAITYETKQTQQQLHDDWVATLKALTGPDGYTHVLNHPVIHTHIMTVRSRGLLATESPLPLGLGLLAAMTTNAVSRPGLGHFFERALFFDTRQPAPFHNMTGFPLHQIPLTPDNIEDALIASCSIPFVINGIRDIAGAPKGIYRDGGIIDYHHDIPFFADGSEADDSDGLVFYPHYSERLVPGWFDKNLHRRQPTPANVDRMIMVAPHPDFVARLPYGKIPDRRDFFKLETSERLKYWRRALDESRRMADEFRDVIEKGDLVSRLTSF